MLDVEPDGGGACLSFADGSRRRFDRVVLALGNYSPSNPPAEGADFYASERYVRDPWIRGSLDVIRPGESVLMLGTGLTALDIALDLAGRGVALPLRAVSRHGLLPHPHAPARVGTDPPPELLSLPMTARGLLSAVRRAARAPGYDWRGVVGALRGATPGTLAGALPGRTLPLSAPRAPLLGRASAPGGADDSGGDRADEGSRGAAGSRGACDSV